MPIIRSISILLLGLLGVLSASAQTQRQWIFFHAKTVSAGAYLPSRAPAYEISPRALQRRAKVRPADRLIDETDLPVDPSLLSSIRSTGATVHTVSRWLNAVSVDGTPGQISAIQALPSVRAVAPVARYHRVSPSAGDLPAMLPRATGALSYSYGSSLTQLSDMHAVELHDLGITGSGVLVAMLDDGFNNHTTHAALKSIHVVAEYDFVQRDSNTSIAPGEYAGEGNHGAGTLSAVGGFDPGKMIGAAPGAWFVLAKTEIDSVEIHTEEDNYVEALEWVERLGADIASSSLGYRVFDPPAASYSWSQLDGHTTIVARAAAAAAAKGLLLVTAMGNEGGAFKDSSGAVVHSDKTLVSPADADSIVSVGAASSLDVLAGFSGTGPAADGRIKPEVVAQGVSVYWVQGSTTNGYTFASGTSCSTPLVAGAAAMILSAHPELTPMQVRQALMNTARHISNGTWQTQVYPNNYFGSGFVHALNAALYYGPIASNQPTITHDATKYTVGIHIRSNAALVADSLRFCYRNPGGPFSVILLSPTGNPYEYAVQIPLAALTAGSVGYFAFTDSAGHSGRSPFNAPDSLFALGSTTPITPGTYVLKQNYPNPFNGGTVITADISAAGSVDLTVYDLLGRNVVTLFHGTAAPPALTVHWDGRNTAGRPVATGTYLCRFTTPAGIFLRKMLYLR